MLGIPGGIPGGGVEHKIVKMELNTPSNIRNKYVKSRSRSLYAPLAFQEASNENQSPGRQSGIKAIQDVKNDGFAPDIPKNLRSGNRAFATHQKGAGTQSAAA